MHSEYAQNLKRFSRTHHIRGTAASSACTLAFGAVFGSVRLHFPFSGSSAVSVPFVSEVPLVLAAIATGSLDSPMRSLEEAGGRTFRRLQIGWLFGVVSLSATLLTALEFATGRPETAWVLLRSLLIWTGFSMLSGRVFGWQLSWILPLATIFPLTYWNFDRTGRYRWWDWTHQPSTGLPCWGIAACSLLIGAAAVAATPWRTNPVRRVSRQLREAAVSSMIRKR